MRRLFFASVLVVFGCAAALGPAATAQAMAVSATTAVHAAGPDGGGFGVGGDGGSGTVDGTANQGGDPGSGDTQGGDGTNDCMGCTYRWVAICDPALANTGCGANACPVGFLMETLMITDPRLPAPIAGETQCRSPSGATPAQVRRAASDQFSQLLTTAHPSQQPADGGVVNLPTLFSTNTPAAQLFNETLLGVQVTLNVDASWTWNFGDGTTLTSTDPGGAYPVASLSHVYPVAGTYTVALTTNWTGMFSMAGGPPAVIPGGPIRRVSLPFALEIHEAHSVLVTG